VFHLVREAGLDVDEVDDLLNRRSGLRGLCGDNDLREIEQRADAGDAAAELALAIYSHRLRKYIGAYTAVLGHVDAVVFTAGVGENSPRVRWEACRGLEQLGIVIDRDRNDDADAGSGVAAVQAEASEVAVLVAATDEERQIAQQTRAAITAAAR
jgi:acetate kinase